MWYFDMTYLSTADRKRIDQLKLVEESSTYTPEERRQAAAEQVEIGKRRKPLSETSFEEANDFRMFLYERFRKLSAVGSSQAVQFQHYIMRVENHIRNLQFDAAKKAMLEEKTKVEIGKGLRYGQPKTGRSQVQGRPAGNPWAIPTDDED